MDLDSNTNDIYLVTVVIYDFIFTSSVWYIVLYMDSM
jgi:hypothetical protein